MTNKTFTLLLLPLVPLSAIGIVGIVNRALPTDPPALSCPPSAAPTTPSVAPATVAPREYRLQHGGVRPHAPTAE